MFRNFLKQLRLDNYLLIAFTISFFTIVPQLLMAHNIKYVFTLIALLLLLLLSANISKIFYTFLTLYLLLITAFQTHIVMHWGSASDNLSSRVAIAMVSPQYETQEYLHDFVDLRDYAVVLYSLLILSTLIYFLLHYQRPILRAKKIAIPLFILLLLILQNQEPLKLLKGFASINERSNILNERRHYLQVSQLSLKKNVNKFYDKIVIVQGEAANKNFLGIYGYEHNTTPFLSKLYTQNRLYRFNVISPSNQTRYAIPMIFTKATVHNWRQGFTHSHSLISDYKQLGYTTHWISNQGEVGKHDDYVTTIAREADETVFVRHYATTDSAILEYLKERPHEHEHELYIFHLMGSHVDYEERYTHKALLYAHPKGTVEKYANTIYYTDYILENILSTFEKKSDRILFIYLSDHGEVVHKQKHGHGFSPSYRDEYEIPFVVYSSIKNPRLEELLLLNKTSIWNAENSRDIIRYISYLTNELNLSTSHDVQSLDYHNVVNFESLHSYQTQK